MFAARIAHKIDLVGKAFIEPHEAPVGQRAVGIELLAAGRIEVRALAFERHQARAVFHHDGVFVFGEAEVEQIRVDPAADPVCVLNHETP